MNIYRTINKRLATKLNETQQTIGPKGAKVIALVKNGRIFVKQSCWKDVKMKNQRIGDLATRHGLSFNQCLDVLAGKVASVKA